MEPIWRQMRPYGRHCAGTSHPIVRLPWAYLTPTSGKDAMKAITLALAGTLILGSAAIAAEGGSGTSKSGTMNSTGAKDAGAGSSPGASGSGPSTGDKSRSGTTNSTGANDAGSGASPGAAGKGASSPTR